MQALITFTDERRQRAWVLRVMCLALMMVSGAVAGLNVALPSIARDTGASLTQLQWIVDAYAIVFAALLVPAGAIGDRYGRKPLPVAGLALFGSSPLRKWPGGLASGLEVRSCGSSPARCSSAHGGCSYRSVCRTVRPGSTT